MLLGSGVRNGKPVVGILDGDVILDLSEVHGLPRSLKGLLEVDPDLNLARQAVETSSNPRNTSTIETSSENSAATRCAD